MTSPVKIGVSACLLGEQVRYDGGHKLNSRVTDLLGHYFCLVPLCPEVECGMPVPREAMRLEGNPANPRLIGISSRCDFTDLMLGYSAAKVRKMDENGLCGFIFKERSPSCGLRMVPLHRDGAPELFTAGLFCNEVAKHLPKMPLMDSELLNDPGIRGSFVEHAFLYHYEKYLRKI